MTISLRFFCISILVMMSLTTTQAIAANQETENRVQKEADSYIPPEKQQAKKRFGIFYLIREGVKIRVKNKKKGAILTLTSEDPQLVREIQENGQYFLKKQKEYDSGEKVIDPVTGTKFLKSKASGQAEYKGKMYYFCCPGIKETFLKNPEKYIK